MLPLNIYLDAMAHGKLEDMYSLMSLYLSATQGCLVFVCVYTLIVVHYLYRKTDWAWYWKLRLEVLNTKIYWNCNINCWASSSVVERATSDGYVPGSSPGWTSFSIYMLD